MSSSECPPRRRSTVRTRCSNHLDQRPHKGRPVAAVCLIQDGAMASEPPSAVATAGEAGESTGNGLDTRPGAVVTLADSGTVARIAYLSSDVVVSVQPALAVDSLFSSHLAALSSRNAGSIVAQAGGRTPEVF